MQKNSLDELLKRHSDLTPLELCATHWVPENNPFDWYLGFLQSLEIHRGIRELFTEKIQPEAYEILEKRIRDELGKFSDQDIDMEMLTAALLAVREQHLDFLQQLDVLCVGALAHPVDPDGAWERVHEFIEQYRLCTSEQNSTAS